MQKKNGSRAKGLRGQKKALLPQQISYLLSLLEEDIKDQCNNARRNLALFRTALCTMLRAGDLMALTINDIWSMNSVKDHILIRQEKTENKVECVFQDETRAAIFNYLLCKYGSAMAIELNLDHPLFELSERQYATIVKSWAKRLSLDPKFYCTHSLRRTKAREIYRVTKNLEAVRLLLGHSSLKETGLYLGVEQEEALDISRGIKF